MKTVIIDYESGNLHSAAKAFERAAEVTGHTIVVSNQASDLKQASHIVLPGVGAFADCMRGLCALPGMVDALNEQVIEGKKPFLGICVGMQLLADKGYEHGETNGLGWIAGEVKAIEPSDPSLKIPHMGWNALEIIQDHPLLAGINTGDHAYFVHSYHMGCENQTNVLAKTDYGNPVTAIVAKDNVMGTQFHPEKSQQTGLTLIENFLRMVA